MRDIVFLKVIAFTGDRAGYLGSALTDQIKWLPNNEGILLRLVTGKTIDIREPRGYFFRPLASSQNEILDASFLSSAANSRLKLYITDLDLWEGETPHSTRSGCALTLAWLGISNELIKSHVSWKSDDMLKHYMAPNVLCDKIKSAKSLFTTSEVIPAYVFANIEQILGKLLTD
ncbi:unnamed protein product [Mytilus coruscus]|uniref:Tyr recombinase domain-containing protein n=1 Tax=Mytilus coruscus TaxID=42192 RepID=A0A6J7ZUA5_MYTCO|nr:unnamed protein product [Mytilus coruscus]